MQPYPFSLYNNNNNSFVDPEKPAEEHNPDALHVTHSQPAIKTPTAELDLGFFSFLLQIKKPTEPATTIVQLITLRRCVAMIFSDRTVLEMNVFPDRKFPLRWVLFSEGDEEGMSMTGYISLSHRYNVAGKARFT